MEKKKFVGFGEIMVRLAPAGVLRFPQADSFTVNYTGAEGNMAIALAYMGMPAEMVTKFPDNDIGAGIATPTKDHETYGGWKATQCSAFADYTSLFHFKSEEEGAT